MAGSLARCATARNSATMPLVFERAINFYKKALSIDSNFTGAHHYIAITYLEMDNLNSAKYHLDKLDLICLFGCEDFYDLKNKIAFYEANNE